MSIVTVVSPREPMPRGFHQPAGCPFRGSANPACRAALFSFPAQRTDELRCDTETHEDCALYLAKVLRSLRPAGIASRM